MRNRAWWKLGISSARQALPFRCGPDRVAGSRREPQAADGFCQGFRKYRGRDSNPRHADYDRKKVVRARATFESVRVPIYEVVNERHL
jgi:hypothetical protein